MIRLRFGRSGRSKQRLTVQMKPEPEPTALAALVAAITQRPTVTTRSAACGRAGTDSVGATVERVTATAAANRVVPSPLGTGVARCVWALGVPFR